MRAYSWIVLGVFAFACGGSAFSAAGNGDGEGGSATGGVSVGQGGATSRGGKGPGGSSFFNGGSLIGNGGLLGKAGSVSQGGEASDGGDVAVGGSVTLGGSTGMAGAGPDPIDEKCPLALPDDPNVGCVDGLSCSYGDDIRSSCRSRAICQDGKWQLTLIECADLLACPHFQVGAKCDAAKPCSLQSTILCLCTGCSGGGPCSDVTTWACAGSSGGNICPEVLPNEGQACAGATKCPYGSCTTEDSITASCDGAAWSWQFGACPL